eukprot:scaffold12546_cov110-Skeletonema_dohrnii-CCMP3373.AAC.6
MWLDCLYPDGVIGVSFLGEGFRIEPKGGSGPSAGLVLRGWMRPEVEGIGSEPLAKTGHSSQAGTLGVPLNHKSNLVPSGSIGHPSYLSVGLYVAMGISTLFGVETNNRQLYQTTSLAVVRDSQAGVQSLPSNTIDIYYDYLRPTSGIFQATSSRRNGYMHALYYG